MRLLIRIKSNKLHCFDIFIMKLWNHTLFRWAEWLGGTEKPETFEEVLLWPILVEAPWRMACGTIRATCRIFSEPLCLLRFRQVASCTHCATMSWKLTRNGIVVQRAQEVICFYLNAYQGLLNNLRDNSHRVPRAVAFQLILAAIVHLFHFNSIGNI